MRCLLEEMRDNPGAISIHAARGAIIWALDRITALEAKQPLSTDKGISAIYAAAKQLDASLTAMSWSGFNIVGDRKSIDEVSRLMFEEVRFKAYRKRVEEGTL